MSILRHCVILLGGVLLCSCAASEPAGSPSTVVPEQATTSTTVQTTTTTLRTTTTAMTTTTSTVLENVEWGEGEADAALASIDSFYTALNSGDVEAALASIASTGRLTDMLPIAAEGLNARFEHDCTVGPARGSVSCVEYVTDDLYGPAGITNHATVSYHYHERKLTVSDRSFVCQADPTGDALSFLMEFRVWAAETHPELERYWLWGAPINSPSAIPCNVYPFKSPEDAIEICKIVPEFVAQSDRWSANDT